MENLALLWRKLADLLERHIHLIEKVLITDTRFPDLEKEVNSFNRVPF